MMSTSIDPHNNNGRSLRIVSTNRLFTKVRTESGIWYRKFFIWKIIIYFSFTIDYGSNESFLTTSTRFKCFYKRWIDSRWISRDDNIIIITIICWFSSKSLLINITKFIFSSSTWSQLRSIHKFHIITSITNIIRHINITRIN